MDRYSRQILFDKIGAAGQRTLLGARVVIIGCGALGSAQAEQLARAGVGFLRLVDRDFVEETNLQRQTLFTEKDAREKTPKAVACAQKITEINSGIKTEAHVVDATSANIQDLVKGSDLVLDGTDNFDTRYLINDLCMREARNWIYGAVLGSYGVTMTIRPRHTACLRCVFGDIPPAGAPTCDTAGVIMPIVSLVASIQVTEALKLLTGNLAELHKSLLHVDVWRNECRRLDPGAPAEWCPCCAMDLYPALQSEVSGFTTVLCGRDAVQVSPGLRNDIDLAALATRLHKAGEVSVNPYLVRFRAGEHQLTVFKDARAIVGGTTDPAVAKSLYTRYLGF